MSRGEGWDEDIEYSVADGRGVEIRRESSEVGDQRPTHPQKNPRVLYPISKHQAPNHPTNQQLRSYEKTGTENISFRKGRTTKILEQPGGRYFLPRIGNSAQRSALGNIYLC